MSDRDAIRSALRRVVDPCSIATGYPIDLIDMGLLEEIREQGDHWEVVLRLTSPICWQAGNILSKVEEALGDLAGDTMPVRCSINAHAEWTPDMMEPEVRAALRRLRPPPSHT
jgi:metal-sulfur cluster biosynthetic enzyme